MHGADRRQFIGKAKAMMFKINIPNKATPRNVSMDCVRACLATGPVEAVAAISVMYFYLNVG